MCATETPDSPVFTLPTYSAMSFPPGTGIRVGCSINAAMRPYFLRAARWDGGDAVDDQWYGRRRRSTNPDRRLRRLQSRRHPGRVIGAKFVQYVAGLHLLPGRRCSTIPAAALTGSSLRARPAPRRQAATPIEKASTAVT